jgi:hypothetical protein
MAWKINQKTAYTVIEPTEEQLKILLGDLDTLRLNAEKLDAQLKPGEYWGAYRENTRTYMLHSNIESLVHMFEVDIEAEIDMIDDIKILRFKKPKQKR